MGNIMIMKLVSSEEIICILEGETPTEYRIKNPMGIGPSPQGSVAVFPWSICTARPSDSEVYTLRKDTVIMCHNAPTELAKSYQNATGRIKVPTMEEKSLILG